jgi:hypothetical protein
MKAKLIYAVLFVGSVGALVATMSEGAGKGPGPLYSDGNLAELASPADALTNLGVTATAAQLNFSAGVTSAIQTQMDLKAPLASPTFTTKSTHSYATATTVATFNGSKELVSSAVTPTELLLLSTADRLEITERVALAAVRTGGGVLAWANPTGGSIIIKSLVLDVTTASSGVSTIDCGVAANVTTLNDTIIDGVSGTPAAVLDSVEDQGTNGVGAVKATTTQAVTCSEASGDVTGIVGFGYITYHPI